MRQKEAAMQLKISIRQVRRIERRVEKEGVVGLCHQNRGKKSPRKIGLEVYQNIVKLCKRDYAGFGPTLVDVKKVV